MAGNLKNWNEVSGLPASLQKRIQQIESEETFSSLEKSFVFNEAVFHKKCTVAYGKEKLKRKSENPQTIEVSILISQLQCSCMCRG